MLTRRVITSRRGRSVEPLPQTARRYRRRHSFEHGRPEPQMPECGRPRHPLGGFILLASALLFLAFIVAGALTPAPGPLTKHEPVSTWRVR
jgi:hypothetical protein